ncbi:MAG: excinuclease ABC subunit UvrA [Candidatus Margulisbacteria bacterium]|nr:excinuclease ABC subunit UvrA [Candidatus Margulisiibacteriota bacterium]
MQQDFIKVVGAKENNLKDISVTIPKNTVTVITGVSGSGKSSLAFDTIFIEGQRKYLESLSSYARQFFGQFKKPDVERIEGLSPSISIEQKSVSHNPRSTVGTLTEIYDYLRLLYSSIAKPFCPECGKHIENQTIDQIVTKVSSEFQGKKSVIMAPLVKNQKGEFRNIIEKARQDGFLRLRIDGAYFHLDEDIVIDKNKKHTIDLVIDRIVIEESKLARIFESTDIALQEGNGFCTIEIDEKDYYFSTHFSCADCGISLPKISPSLFSFNNPQGACPTCKGLGVTMDFTLDSFFYHKSVSLKYWLNYIGGFYVVKPFTKELRKYAKDKEVSLFQPIENIPREFLEGVFYGDDDYFTIGLRDMLRIRFRETKSEYRKKNMEKAMDQSPCHECGGKRLRKEVLAMKIEDKNIIDLTELSIRKLLNFVTKANLTPREEEISRQVILELKNRLSFMLDIGLDYLTLERAASTLSGGEAQRLRLATQMGFGLSGVLYVMDEPTIGLHPRDNDRLIVALGKLKDLGNTLIVVEHDRDIMLHADYLIEIGPEAGSNGGQLMFEGKLDEYLKTDNLTADYLNHKRNVVISAHPDRQPYGEIEIKGAKMHNLKGIDIKIPLGQFTCVTGVSGSGKSTLIFDVFYKNIKNFKFTNLFSLKGGPEDNYTEINGMNNLDKLIVIDQSPIGRTPRSNPATYIGLFDKIRTMFATTKEAKKRGYKPGRFSFNVPGGRCEACKGDGSMKIEMLFLPDVYVPCDVCKGKRYNSQTLEVKYKGYNISDILEMPVAEAVEVFVNVPSIMKYLKMLLEVGLDYIKLGQSATTLSGGEAQRVKLASELTKTATGKTLYILDEPTTGLHFADVNLLLKVLQKLVDKGNTVLVIEHHTDVINSADYIIDLGPDGGEKGGELVYQGNLGGIKKVKKSHTAKYL